MGFSLSHFHNAIEVVSLAILYLNHLLVFVFGHGLYLAIIEGHEPITMTNVPFH